MGWCPVLLGQLGEEGLCSRTPEWYRGLFRAKGSHRRAKPLWQSARSGEWGGIDIGVGCGS